LTVPHLDFDAIRAEIGGISGPILEAMAQMSPAQRRRANEILDRHEMDAAENSQLNPGAAAVLGKLRQDRRGIGVLTRNSHRSVQRICRIHKLVFDAVVTREDGPVKPDPFGVYRACEMIDVTPERTWLVGDYLFDLIAARRAGATSVLLSTNENYGDFLSKADHLIASLEELPGLIATAETADDL